MKISEEVKSLYRNKSYFGHNATVLADALQQAVAENLELKHRLHFHGTLPEYCAGCFKKDWLAEADKLLRGEK